MKSTIEPDRSGNRAIALMSVLSVLSLSVGAIVGVVSAKEVRAAIDSRRREVIQTATADSPPPAPDSDPTPESSVALVDTASTVAPESTVPQDTTTTVPTLTTLPAPTPSESVPADTETTAATSNETAAAIPPDTSTSDACPPTSNARPADSEFQEVIVVYDVIRNGAPDPNRQSTYYFHRTRDLDHYSYIYSAKHEWNEWRLYEGVTYHRRSRYADFTVENDTKWPDNLGPPLTAYYRYPDFDVNATAVHDRREANGNCHYRADLGAVPIDKSQTPPFRWETTVNRDGHLIAIYEQPADAQFQHHYSFTAVSKVDFSPPPCPRLEQRSTPPDTKPFLCGAPPQKDPRQPTWRD
jgi:hypothetical protein